MLKELFIFCIGGLAGLMVGVAITCAVVVGAKKEENK